MFDFQYISLLQIVALLCSIIFVTKWFWGKRHRYFLSMKIPGPLSLPFLGSVSYAWTMHKKGTQHMILQGNQKYNGFFRLWLGTHLYIVALRPEDVESIFCSHVTNKPPIALSHWIDCMGNGVVTKTDLSKDPLWKIHKKIINPSLGGNMMIYYYDYIRANGYHLEKEIGKICNKGFVNFGKQLLRFCCDSVAESMYGVEFRFRDGHRDEVLSAIDVVTDTVVEKFTHVFLLIEPIYNLSDLAKKQRAATKRYREFAKEILETKLSNSSKNVKYPTNATMKLLLDAYENGLMTASEVVEEIMNLWIAASDTVGSASEFLILCLAMHKPCQDKVFQEIKKICGDNQNAIVEFEDLHRFTYTEMCIKEALRLFGPGPFAGRHNSHSFTFKSRNLHIPADTTFIISSYATHRDPENWTNPEEFIPERFIPEECAKRHPYAFIPFSGGPRKCGGRAYAMMLLKTCVIHLIRKYEFRCDWKIEDLSLEFLVSIRNKEGYKAYITERVWN